MPVYLGPRVPKLHRTIHHPFYEFRPPYDRTYARLSPTDLVSFAIIHRERHTALASYVQHPRSNYTQSFSLALWDELHSRNARNLHSCNAEARIAFATVACQMFRRFGIAGDGPHSFITVCPAEHVFLFRDAHGFDPRVLQAQIRQAMGSIPFVGMIEAALYKSWWPWDIPQPDHVSWHAHVLVWGVAPEVIKARLAALGSKPNILGGRSIRVRSVWPDRIERALLYMLKGQLKEYRLNAFGKEQVDPATGEITVVPRQQKRWMYTGNHVRMCRVLEPFRLDDLLFGNGQGTLLVKAIRYEAMKPFCTWVAPLNRAAEARGCEPPYPQVERNRKLGVALRRLTGLEF